MRGLLQPLLIVIAVVLVALGLTAGVRTFSGSPADLDSEGYQCPACNGQNLVELDLLVWTCKYCGARHWQGVGKLPPHGQPAE